MNWNSTTKQFTPVKSDRVRAMKNDARLMRYVQGYSSKDIANKYNISLSRVSELLK